MLRKIYYIISIICIIVFLSTNESTYANSNTPPSIEEMHTQVGYKSVEEAVKEFENHFKRDIKLPKIKPSIPFTHEFGRFYEDKKYNINDFLEIKFINKNLRENNYKLDIRPSKNKVVFKNKETQQLYTLQSGQKAIYYTGSQLFNILVFEKDNWQYILGIDKRISNEVTPEILVQIANSIE